MRAATSTSPMRGRTSGSTAPNQPASIASSRVATHARADSRRSPERPPRHPDRRPVSRCSWRQRGSPATCRTPASSSAGIEDLRRLRDVDHAVVGGRRAAPGSAASAGRQECHGGIELVERCEPLRRLRARARGLDVELRHVEVDERRSGQAELVAGAGEPLCHGHGAVIGGAAQHRGCESGLPVTRRPDGDDAHPGGRRGLEERRAALPHLGPEPGRVR